MELLESMIVLDVSLTSHAVVLRGYMTREKNSSEHMKTRGISKVARQTECYKEVARVLL